MGLIASQKRGEKGEAHEEGWWMNHSLAKIEKTPKNERKEQSKLTKPARFWGGGRGQSGPSTKRGAVFAQSEEVDEGEKNV